MGFFDRFKSNKGKAASAKPKAKVKPSADDAKQRAFANVPAGAEASPKPAKKEPAAPAKAKAPAGEGYRMLLKPVVTEKSSRTPGQYTFDVPLVATKADVRHAVYHLYGIKPVSVNVIRQAGKDIRYGRFYGRTTHRKKAIVTLPDGKTIDAFSA